MAIAGDQRRRLPRGAIMLRAPATNAHSTSHKTGYGEEGRTQTLIGIIIITPLLGQITHTHTLLQSRVNARRQAGYLVKVHFARLARSRSASAASL